MFGQGSQEWWYTPVVRATEKQRQEDCHELEASLGRPSCLSDIKTISGEIKWLDLQPSTPEEQRPLRGLRDKLNEGRKPLWAVQQGLIAN